MPAYRLTAEHAGYLAAMESAYPGAMRQGESALQAKLALLEQSRFSFSHILLESGVVHGYIVAYPSRSMVDSPRPEFVVYVDDLQVRQGQTADLYRLIKLMVEDKEANALSHLHIEALCRRSASRVLAEHPKVIGRLGYDLLGSYEYWDDDLGEAMSWMRWAPMERAVARASHERLELSSDVLEELDLGL